MIPAFLVYGYVEPFTPGPANLFTLAAALRHGKSRPPAAPMSPAFAGASSSSWPTCKVMVFCLTALASYVLPYSQGFRDLLALSALSLIRPY